jgi:hypothetical protein
VQYEFKQERVLDMNKPPFSREKAIQAVNVSHMIEGYKPTTDKKVKKQVRKIIRAIQLSTASER